MLYFAGALLFACALGCALAVTFMTFAQYRDRMIAALRTLNLDGIYGPQRSAIAPDPSGLAISARRQARMDRRPGRPAPSLAV